jgi:hypothetical protein
VHPELLLILFLFTMANAKQLKELRRKYHLGEFRRSSRSSGSVRQITKTKISRGESMAKRRIVRSRSRGSFGGNMMKAPIKTSGIVQDALVGVGGALAVAKFAPNINIPYKYPLAGYLVGGVSGAVAAWFVMGASSSGTATSGGIELN